MDTRFSRWIGKIQARSQKITSFEEKIGNSLILTSIRRGLTLLIPVILIGSFALLITSLPLPEYQRLMYRLFGEDWQGIFTFIHDGTTNILSLLVVMCVSYSYSLEKAEKIQFSVNPVIAASVSVCSFVALFGLHKENFKIDNFGVVGVFVATLVAVSSSVLFHKLSTLKAIRIKAFSDGDSMAFNYALSAILPATLTVLVYAMLNETLFALFGISDIQTFLSDTFSSLFANITSPFLSGILFILMIHIFWFFGIHGNNVLEPVAQNVFVPAMQMNQIMVGTGHAPTQILTKTFFDTFVLMGGCGSALCLMFAILLVGKNKSQRRIVKLSAFPVLFNINELITFGIPIVLNPVYLIPFLFVPILLTVTSFAAMSLGLVPYTQRLVEWTTPVILSGYVSTGSVRGCFLQLFNLLVGTLCYIPFVKLAQTVSDFRVKCSINSLYVRFKKSEERGIATELLKRHDEIGNIARLLAGDLKNVIQQNKLALYYQPQVDYDGNVLGAEALLRWNHRSYGYIYPPLIIALAEESNQMDLLGNWIFETACHDLKKLGRLGLGDMSVSVNVSAGQLENASFALSLKKIIEKHQINPNMLKIEITEQVALASGKHILDQIFSIQELGVKLEMDDFGMGHSSLMYLKEYNFDTVKLDGSLVRELCTNSNCCNIISSIVYLSKSLNYSVLAEYVEDQQQRDVLHSLGCNRYQGYLYSKAVPFKELIEFIQIFTQETAASLGG